jgi:predicted DNA-binding ribbon-helix-helix protein
MLEKRSFSLSGHRTSVALEPEFWAALAENAKAGGASLSALITDIDSTRAEGQPLASALRVFALKAGRRAATGG